MYRQNDTVETANLLARRCARYVRFVEGKAPKVLIDEEIRLINKAFAQWLFTHSESIMLVEGETNGSASTASTSDPHDS